MCSPPCSSASLSSYKHDRTRPIDDLPADAEDKFPSARQAGRRGAPHRPRTVERARARDVQLPIFPRATRLDAPAYADIKAFTTAPISSIEGCTFPQRQVVSESVRIGGREPRRPILRMQNGQVGRSKVEFSFRTLIPDVSSCAAGGTVGGQIETQSSALGLADNANDLHHFTLPGWVSIANVAQVGYLFQQHSPSRPSNHRALQSLHGHTIWWVRHTGVHGDFTVRQVAVQTDGLIGRCDGIGRT